MIGVDRQFLYPGGQQGVFDHFVHGFDEEEGDLVPHPGDLLLELDLPFLEANAPSTAVPMIFTALPDSKKVVILKKGDVKPDEDIVEVTDK